MADIVSVEWNVEESRRLITEQPHPSDPGIAVEKTVRLLNVQINSPASTPDDAAHTSSTDRESDQDSLPSASQITVMAVNDIASNPIINGVVWTAIGLGDKIEESTPPEQKNRALDTALQSPDPVTTNLAATTNHNSSREGEISPVERAELGAGSQKKLLFSVISARPEAPKVSDESILSGELRQRKLPMTGSTVTQFAAAAHDEIFSPLRKAILDPDIYTEKADRDRAIGLRWTLRDIVANRLRLLPVSDLDLQTLIDLRLVELKDGVPLLTSIGMTAIN